MTGYRCEEFFGESRRDAASVMAHETFVLADLGKKGKLYGYEKLPEASCSVQMENNL